MRRRIDALAIRDGKVQIRSYPSAHGGSSSQSGWEYVEGLDLPVAPRVAEEAAASFAPIRARRK